MLYLYTVFAVQLSSAYLQSPNDRLNHPSLYIRGGELQAWNVGVLQMLDITLGQHTLNQMIT